MHAGIIPVRAQGDEWTLQANTPRTRPVVARREDLAAMLGLDAADIGGEPLWVDTGSEQLVIPLATTARRDPLRAAGGPAGAPRQRRAARRRLARAGLRLG